MQLFAPSDANILAWHNTVLAEPEEFQRFPKSHPFATPPDTGTARTWHVYNQRGEIGVFKPAGEDDCPGTQKAISRVGSMLVGPANIAPIKISEKGSALGFGTISLVMGTDWRTTTPDERYDLHTDKANSVFNLWHDLTQLSDVAPSKHVILASGETSDGSRVSRRYAIDFSAGFFDVSRRKYGWEYFPVMRDNDREHLATVGLPALHECVTSIPGPLWRRPVLGPKRALRILSQRFYALASPPQAFEKAA